MAGPRRGDPVHPPARALGDQADALETPLDLGVEHDPLGGDRPARVDSVLGRVDMATAEAVDRQRCVRVFGVVAVVEVEEECHRPGRLHGGNCKTALVDVFQEIAKGAEAESPLWSAALRPDGERELVAVFSGLAPDTFALGLETVYEAYLVHYGHPRLFAAGEESERVLLGDYLYAHGLVRIAEAGGVDAVATMAELISRCAALS